jgi:cytochrome P450
MSESPQPPYFDADKQVWILTRYADVLAALQNAQLAPTADIESRDEMGRLRVRGDVLARFSQATLAEWRPRMESEALRILQSLEISRPVDLFREFCLPWGLTIAMLATGADPADREKLSALGTRVFAATGAAEDSPLRPEAAAATAELNGIFQPIPLGEPTFVALSQTNARLLASCWHALAAHPAEYARLRAQPELIPGAVEEMLRYAGIVRRVYRRATAALEIGSVGIPEGAQVALMLAIANRDPAQFPAPESLDIARPTPSHFALGYGRNSCVGGNPVRLAVAVATGALAATFAEVRLHTNAEWRTGSGFSFPSAVEVTCVK